MAGRRINPNAAKGLLCYSIAETATLYGVHRNTVRNWLDEGLLPIDDRRPILIHGSELKRFHRQRRDNQRTVCGPGEIYCLRCRKPRRPAGGMAEYRPTSDKLGTIIAICEECENLIAQRVNTSRLADFKRLIDVSSPPAHKSIDESPSTHQHCDLSEKDRGR